MTSRLFRVDMSEGSRDFAAVATEPGLAMLDAAGANYTVLRRWFGTLVAEPEMQSPELASFYVREPERGRLENLQCHTVTVKDLRGPLKPDLDAIETAIRKAKPESSNEKLLHKIIAKTFKEQTAELEKSDYDCYFFKYRQSGGPWRLVWCWGYQRRDHEPSRAVICSNDSCHRLFAHRPNTKRRCPSCETIAVRKRRPLALGAWPLALLLLLLLAAGVGAYALLVPRKETEKETLAVKPDAVEMVVGQRREIELTSSSPDAVTFTSSDPEVVTVNGTQTLVAGKAGKADVKFALGKIERTISVTVKGPPKYKHVEIRPAKIALTVGQSHGFEVVGIKEDDGQEVLLGESQIVFKRQPLAAHVELDRQKMQLRALLASNEPLPLEVQLGDLPLAKAEVSVAAASTATPTVVAVSPTGAATGTVAAVTPLASETWGVYPPVNIKRPGTAITAVPTLGGPLRFVPGQGLIADKVVAGSPLELAGVAPGTTISHIGDTDIRHLSPVQLSDWLAKNPIADRAKLTVVGEDGKVKEVKLGIDVDVLMPVRVLGIVPSNVSANAFDASVRIQVRDRAEYRIVDDKMHELGPWTTHGPAIEATIQITQIPRSAGRNEYDMYVERRLAGDVKRYPFLISLSPRPK